MGNRRAARSYLEPPDYVSVIRPGTVVSSRQTRRLDAPRHLEAPPEQFLPLGCQPRRPAVGGMETTMSYLKTAILLAGLTGLFMGVGYLIGGASGALIALVIAAATNLFAYWNSDRMV